MKIGCEVCQRLLSSVSSWQNHLAGEEHQRICHQRMWHGVTPAQEESEAVANSKDSVNVPTFIKWDSNDKGRAVVLNEFKHIVTDPKEILKHFSAFGFVTEFICDPYKYFAIIQYDDKETAEQLVTSNYSGYINGRIIRLRLMPQISQLEWVISLNIDAKYDKYDQEFFIHHLETMSEVSGLDIDQQFHGWLVKSSVDSTGIATRQTIMRDLGFIIRQSFPKLYMYPMQPLMEGFEDVDGVFEIYMDPFASCGSSVTPPLTPDYALPEFQMAIIRILYILQNQTILPGGEKYCSEVTVYPPNVIIGGTNQGQLIRGINFYHKNSGTHCRISFDGVMKSNVCALMVLTMSLDVRVLPFLRFIRYWARIHRFTKNHPEILDMLTMMVYIYMVKKNILPSVWSLQQLARIPTNSHDLQPRHFFVEGWDVTFTKDVHQADAYMVSRGKIHFEPDVLFDGATDKYKSTLGKHGTRVLLLALLEFFEAFGCLNWKDHVLCPFVGELLSRNCFEPGQEASLPTALNLYKLRSFNNRLNVSQPIIIQHPFNLACNLAEHMDEILAIRFNETMRDTSNKIREALTTQDKLEMSSLFPAIQSLLKMERRDSNPTTFSPSLSPNSRSINMAGLGQQEERSPPLIGPSGSESTLTYSLVAKKAAHIPQSDSKTYQSNNACSNTTGHLISASEGSNSVAVKLLKFEVNKRFKEAFLTACQGLGGEYKLKDRLKTLAIVFMRDFAWSVWGRCFYLHTTSEKVPDTEPKFHAINRMFEARFPTCGLQKSPDSSDSYISDIPDGAEDYWGTESCGSLEDGQGDCEPLREYQWEVEQSDDDDHNNNDPWHRITSSSRKEVHANEYTLFGKEKKRTISATSDKSAVSNLSEKDKAEELRVKFAKIPKCACKNYCQIMKLHGYQKIWTNRRGVRAAMSLHQKLSKQTPKDKESPVRASSSTDVGSATALTNPLDKEESITRAVLEGITGWGKTPAKRAVWSFEATVRIDTAKDFPTLFMAIKEGKNAYVCQNMINYFSNHFPQLFAEYMAYRLSKWLDNTTTTASPR